MLLGADAEPCKTFKIKLLNVVRRGFHDDLELMVLIETVRVIPIAAVRGAARRLDIGDIPRLGAEHAQERPRAHRSRALFYVVRLRKDAALPRPKLLQCEDNLLEFHTNNSSNKKPRSFIECAVSLPSNTI